MQSPILAAWILDLSLIVAALLASGRFSMTGDYLYDRLTGKVWVCYGEDCNTATFDAPIERK
jgi:hypothetical protein